ncbi:restriction endonuclease subunit S [Endozoicomonas ascidiicola]|uniref:restriction endonuclease subunit S n=1 Tax=Endozoicomonas ascidiicola TaxID=1698521 RepID=UPI00082C604D|nr:restriction endonuclease subunit S [Endozoicomonas ascidiicola]
MVADFFDTTIGDQVTLQRGFDITKKQQQPGEIPVVSSGGISSFHNESKVQAPGVVLGRKGSLGTAFYLDKDYWPHDTTLWVKDFKGNNPRFVYYFFRNMAEALKKMDVGAANPALNRNHVHLLPTKWPKREIQDHIDNLISVLDDKIQLNRQTNQTLEAMAQALFKSWFVDFDPVIDNALAAGHEIPEPLQARAEQRKAFLSTDASDDRLPESIRQLFPNCFVFDAEMGWIPEGWEVKPIYNLAVFVNGAAYKAFNPNKNQQGLPIIKIAELKSGITPQTGFSTIEMPEKYRLKDEDILFSWSGNPDTSIDTFVWPLGPAWLNQHIFRVDPNTDISRSFLLGLLRYLRPVFAEIARDKQTTGLGHVTVKNLKELMVTVPDEKLVRAFDLQVDSLFSKSFGLTKSIQSLAKLRDTLLPKLISGELRLPENTSTEALKEIVAA